MNSSENLCKIEEASALSLFNQLGFAGLYIQGREYIDGLLKSSSKSMHDQVVSIFVQGRIFGICLYQDPVDFDPRKYTQSLYDLGFSANQALTIISNLRNRPAPETSGIERF